jgi:6-phosphogluconate dehydrogenase
MQIGMIGVGRMGANMVQRLLADGHQWVVYDQDETASVKLVDAGATSAESLESLVGSLESPRAIWVMLPAAAVDDVITQLSKLLDAGDTVIDGGNSNFEDDLRHAEVLAACKIDYVDVGTSGGVWGLERGYCLMIGGEKKSCSSWIRFFSRWRPRPTKGICIAADMAPAISSRWSTMESNTV